MNSESPSPSLTDRTMKVAVVILFLGFAARMNGIGSPSLSYDEGLSLYYVRWPLPVATAFVSATEHGPLYSVQLAEWTKLAGTSEFAARFLSAWASMAMVALVFALFRRLLRGRRRTGFVVATMASFAVAAVPAQWRIAQEAVPYAWMTLWNVLGLYGLVAILEIPARFGSRGDRPLGSPGSGDTSVATAPSGAGRWGPWLVFTGACIAAVYTDPLSWVPVVAFWLLALLKGVWSGQWAPVKVVSAAVMLCGLAFAWWFPFAALAWQNVYAATGMKGDGGGAVLGQASASSAGRSVSVVTRLLLMLDHQGGRRLGFLEPARPDFRGLVGYLKGRAMPNEAMILVGGHAFSMFDYYAQGRWDTYPLPTRLPAAKVPPLDERQLAARLDRMVEDGHRQVWLIQWQPEVVDPAGLTLAMLSAKGRSTPVEEQFEGLDVRRFELPKGTAFSGAEDGG